MTELNELEWELDGVLLDVAADGDSGLDGPPEVEGGDEANSGDGNTSGIQRLASRAIGITTGVCPGAPEIDDDSDVHEQFAAILDQLVQAMSPWADRSALRLLRWRRLGEVTKRLWVKPAYGSPMTIPGDQERLKYASAKIGLRLEAPDPVIRSDELHTVTFSAGETKTIVNAGTFTALQPTAWSLSCSAAGGVVLSNLDHGETIKLPKGPVTVNERRECVTSDTYGIVYGPGSRLFPKWPLLRPGDNTIKATAACTFSWRDTW